MNEARRVSALEAKALCDEGHVYLDVRTEEEFAAGHPTGAQNVPFLLAAPSGMTPNPDFMVVILAAYPSDTPLVIGCRSGVRSLKAAALMIAAGYSRIVDQRAGYSGARSPFGQVTEPGWVESGLPTEQITLGGSYAEVKATR